MRCGRHSSAQGRQRLPHPHQKELRLVMKQSKQNLGPYDQAAAAWSPHPRASPASQVRLAPASASAGSATSS
eukprot:7145945-Pyramimonas_sp.AAC.1